MGTRSSTNGRKREILVKQRDDARQLCVELAAALQRTTPVELFTEGLRTAFKSWAKQLGMPWPQA